jgi:D-glycero-D-manno-heptose 1,7-bisphosphate phosphatase
LMGKPAVFLDRDGVINVRILDDYVRVWDDFRFLPGSLEAVRRLGEMGYPVVVITNQQGIGKGLMTEEGLREIHRRMLDAFKEKGGEIEAVYHCPHLAGDDCDCRKPGPGLILRAARDLDLDLPASYMVGDGISDVEAGVRAGCRPVFLGEREEAPSEVDCLVFADLISFTSYLEGV